MFVKVHKPVNTPCVCDNKDRCRALVEYLLKESLEDKPYYDTFFSHEEDYVPPVTVMQKIDSNHKKLMKGDDKFYMLSINPSQDEAAHLIRKVTGKQVTEFEQLTVKEQEKVIHEYGPVCGEFSQGEDKLRKGSCFFWEGGNGTPLQEQ